MVYLLFALLLSTIALVEVSIQATKPHDKLCFQVAELGNISPDYKRLENLLALGVLLLGVAGYVCMVFHIS